MTVAAIMFLICLLVERASVAEHVFFSVFSFGVLNHVHRGVQHAHVLRLNVGGLVVHQHHLHAIVAISHCIVITKSYIRRSLVTRLSSSPRAFTLPRLLESRVVVVGAIVDRSLFVHAPFPHYSRAGPPDITIAPLIVPWLKPASDPR